MTPSGPLRPGLLMLVAALIVAAAIGHRVLTDPGGPTPPPLRPAVVTGGSSTGESLPDIAPPADGAAIERLARRGRDLEARGEADSARAAFTECLRGLEALPTPDAKLRADVAGRLGWLEMKRGANAEAIPLLESAIAGAGTVGRGVSPADAKLLSRLAVALTATGSYAEAAPRFKVALAAQSAAPDSFRGDHLWTLNAYAGYLQRIGDATGSLPIYESLIAARETGPGADPVLLAWSCHDYAVALHALGRFRDAERFYERAVHLRRAASVAPAILLTSLRGWAVCLTQRGDYRLARAHAEEALALAREVLGGTNPGFGVYLSDLGTLQRLTGDAESALASLTAADTLLAAGGEAEARARGGCLVQLAEVHHRRGDSGRAAELLRGARALHEASFGPTSIPALAARTQLARIEAAQGAFPAAEREFREILDVLASVHPGADFEFGRTARLYAAALLDAGRGTEARTWYRRALAALEADLPAGHSSLLLCRRQFAEACAGQGRPEEAWDEALTAERIGREQYLRAIRAMTERSALLYLESQSAGLDLLLGLAATEYAADPVRVGEAWERVMAARSAIFDETARRMRAGHDAGDSTWTRFVDAVRLEEDAMLHELGPREEGPGRGVLAEATARREDAEQALALRRAAGSPDPPMTVAEVRRHLPSGAALVSFSRFTHRTPAGEVASYCAFVAAGGRAPRMVSLGAAEPIDAAIREIRSRMAVASRRVRVDPAAAEREYKVPARELTRLVWEPLLPRLAGTTWAMLVPDGDLHFVNFYALIDGGGAYLAEGPWRFSILTAEADLRPAPPPGAGPMLAVGGVAYDPASWADLAALDPTLRGAAADPGDCAAWLRRTWEPLPASSIEADRVAGLWRSAGPAGVRKVVRLRGEAAEEEAVRRALPGARVAHLATHAFSVPEACFADEDSPAGAVRGGGIPGTRPLPGCGLVFARSDRKGSRRGPGQDGYLTAEEVACLDLRGMEWAVLSACGTAAGIIADREGIFGLPRAFRVAGARTVFAALWSVEDEASLAWMEALYAARFGEGLPTVDAWKRTDVEILRRLRSTGRSTHPLFWAGPVALGDWR